MKEKKKKKTESFELGSQLFRQVYELGSDREKKGKNKYKIFA